MRITGGEFGGRVLAVPKSGAIRPTQDRVRAALFSIIQGEVQGADFLDLFAGTGATGLEALSRGARSATFVESARAHLAALRRNLDSIRETAGRTSVVGADAYRYVAAYAGEGFAIAFADPPYALWETHPVAEMLAALACRNVVRPGGLFIGEMTCSDRLGDVAGWELLRERTYGATRIAIWRRLAP